MVNVKKTSAVLDKL